MGWPGACKHLNLQFDHIIGQFDRGIKVSHQSECAGVHGRAMYVFEGEIVGFCHFFQGS
jgi:hypothetical protein